MISKLLVITCVLAMYPYGRNPRLALQNSQSAGTSQTSPAGTRAAASGERSITGCVVREGDGFVLKAEEGTYQFNTDRDLSPYVGKKVKISGSWKTTGITTTAPIKESAASTEQSNPTNNTPAAQSFQGDLQLHISGTVVGDCTETK